MTTQKMAPHLKKCKRLILEGYRGQALADSLGISKRTAYNYVKQLEFMGEIIDITGDNKSTPKIYEDARAKVGFASEFAHINNDSQTDGKEADYQPFSKRDVPSTYEEGKECNKDNVVRFHCTGCYEIPVIVVGDHAGRIVSADGSTLGQWSEIKNCKGSIRQYGRARLYPSEDIKFTFYHARKGPKMTVTPNDRMVYYKTADKVGPRLLKEQVNRLLDVLTENHNWKFGQPVDKTTSHYALISPNLAPLLKYADRHKDPENARVHVDTSEGSPEVEIYDDHEGAIDDVITIYELPAQIDSIKAGQIAIQGTLRVMASNMADLTSIVAQLMTNQAKTIEAQATVQIRDFDGRGYQ